MDKLQILFSKYQEKYPLHRTEVIIDKMLDDGVITFEDAKNLREGKSIFSLNNNYFSNFDDNTTTTEIMGGYFTTKSVPETNFNKKIEPTIQPYTQGDCWLLSDINALSETEWGKKAIEEAIIPDADGTGGVTIKFKGSPLEQKEIHITAEEIEKARQSGNYSSGDDDMIAFELATEKTFKQMVKLGLAERTDNDEAIQRRGGKFRSYIWGGVKTKDYDQFPISKLLGINVYKVGKINEENVFSSTDKDNLLKHFSFDKDNISAWCAFALPFDGFGDENSKDHVHGGHAYAIKDLTYGKEVILRDPHYSDYEIKLKWKDFVNLVQDITFSFKDNNTEKRLKEQLPQNFEQKLEKNEKEYSDLKNKLFPFLKNN